MPPANTVFMFSGQGSQYFQMGRRLYQDDDVFRRWMIHLDDFAREWCGESVIDVIHSRGKAEAFDRTAHSHPAIFMVEYALARCLIERGVRPDLCLGASLGSFAAAAVAGHVSVEDAMQAVLAQAEAFEGHCERGAMIAILADPALYAQPFLSERSELAAVNFSGHFAVAAPQAALAPIEEELRARAISFQRLAVSYAFHSRWIEPAQAPFAAATAALPLGRGALPVVCCEQAAVLDELPQDFFWRVVRQPIRFGDAIAQLERSGPHRYLDLGPSGTLATFAKYLLPQGTRSTTQALMTPYGQDEKLMAAVLASAQPA